jgi:hypothetical protein
MGDERARKLVERGTKGAGEGEVNGRGEWEDEGIALNSQNELLPSGLP